MGCVTSTPNVSNRMNMDANPTKSSTKSKNGNSRDEKKRRQPTKTTESTMSIKTRAIQNQRRSDLDSIKYFGEYDFMSGKHEAGSHASSHSQAEYHGVLAAPKAGGRIESELDLIPEENVLHDISSIFTMVRKLGSGVSCEVWEAIRNSDGRHFALKKLLRTARWSGLLFETESTILNHLQHPGIIRLEGVFADDEFYYILTELGHIDLFSKIKEIGRFEDELARLVVRRILETLKYMHDMNLVHRDLKPENVIFLSSDPYQPKLIDLGDGIKIEKRKVYTEFVGTPCYLAPERLREHYGWELKRSDAWAVGVMAYEMMTGKRCFYGRNQKSTFDKIRRGAWHWPKGIKDTLSSEFKNFVEHLLVVDARRRYSVNDALQHPWISSPSRMMPNTTISEPMRLTASNSHTTPIRATRAARPKRASASQSQRSSISLSDFDSRISAVFTQLASNTATAPQLQQLLVVERIGNLTSGERQKIQAMFDGLDTDHDGFISANDLVRSFVQEGMPYAESVAFSRAVIQELDMDQDGKIGFEEFQASHQRYRLSTSGEDELRQEFNRLDLSRDGFLDMGDLRKFSRTFGPGNIQKMIAEVDEDGDGRLSFNNFANAAQGPQTKMLTSIEIPTS